MNSICLDCSVCKQKVLNGLLLNGKFICRTCELKEYADFIGQKNKLCPNNLPSNNPSTITPDNGLPWNTPSKNESSSDNIKQPCYACGMG